MKRKTFAGTTSVALPIFVQDTTSATGGGLAIVFNTAGLVAEYRREGQNTWTAIALVAGTLGTYLSGSIIADGVLTGAYEFCAPDACFVPGARWAEIRLRSAVNMLPVIMEIELDYSALNAGNTIINSNSSGPAGATTAGFLSIKDTNNNGIGGAQVLAYLSTEFNANPNSAVPRGYAISAVDGSWANMLLNGGFNYTFLARGPDGRTYGPFSVGL